MFDDDILDELDDKVEKKQSPEFLMRSQPENPSSSPQPFIQRKPPIKS